MTNRSDTPASPTLWIAIGVAAALVAATGAVVDLAPHVDRGFFFASGDPALRVEATIEGRFGSAAQVLILAASADVSSPHHLAKIRALTRDLESVRGVRGVRSLVRGPDDLADARESPLWRRLLLAGDGSTSFVIVEFSESQTTDVIASLEELVERHADADFALDLAGIPYTVEVMRRELVRDFTVFSLAAVLVFGAAILLIFRSGWIVLGTVVTCTSAVAATLLLLHGLDLGIGLLTANLTTIVFVLAQSHVVFMASNWQALGAEASSAHERVVRARRETLRASVGSAATTLLGFTSLLFVPARPLQELGAGGSIGAVVAFAAAYLLLPVFLERARPRPVASAGTNAWVRATGTRAVALAGVCTLLAIGIVRLDTDPSLLAYFDDDGEVHAALEELDRAGGSSPLSLVVRDPIGEPLDGAGAYERLWVLQRALEAEPTVGRVISLPVLLSEAKRMPLASLLPEDWILDIMGPETTGRFLTADRRQALFLLQMNENERENRRTEEIDRIRELVARNGFEVSLAGAIYALQGRLADLVARSVVWSLAALVLLFGVVATAAAASLRVGVAASAATAFVPLATLGGFGVFGVPLDVIAAPAASVGLGLAADATLHLIAARRRHRDGSSEDCWQHACAEQWRGVARSTGIVALGFGLFALSSFPPTRRFGFGVAVAALFGAAVALWLLPEIARRLEAAGRRSDQSQA